MSTQEELFLKDLQELYQSFVFLYREDRILFEILMKEFNSKISPDFILRVRHICNRFHSLKDSICQLENINKKCQIEKNTLAAKNEEYEQKLNTLIGQLAQIQLNREHFATSDDSYSVSEFERELHSLFEQLQEILSDICEKSEAAEFAEWYKEYLESVLDRIKKYYEKNKSSDKLFDLNESVQIEDLEKFNHLPELSVAVSNCCKLFKYLLTVFDKAAYFTDKVEFTYSEKKDGIQTPGISVYYQNSNDKKNIILPWCSQTFIKKASYEELSDDATQKKNTVESNQNLVSTLEIVSQNNDSEQLSEIDRKSPPCQNLENSDYTEFELNDEDNN